MRYKVSGAIAIPKASWGCAPALPNRIQVVFLRAMFHMKQSEVRCNCSGGTVVTKYYFTENPLLLGIPSESGSARLGHIPSLPWESQLPLKPFPSLLPSDFNGNCDSFDLLLDFCCI